MYFLRICIVFILPFMAITLEAKSAERFQGSDFLIDVPDFFVENIEQPIGLTCVNLPKLATYDFSIPVMVNGKWRQVDFAGGSAEIYVVFDRTEPISVKIDDFVYVRTIKPVPLWLGIIPPLLVIVFALVFKEVISSLVLGVLLGSCITGYYTNGIVGVFTGFFKFIDVYIIGALADDSHLSVIVFSILIGGIVTVISKNGGMKAVVDKLSRKATNPRNGQMTTYTLGLVVFFDDYANALVVGNTMRPLSDKLRISREKLSYIVDSTSAPMAAIALITTWIGAELGYIQSALGTINSASVYIGQSAYSIFLDSLQYAFYPILTLLFVFMVIWQKRDFGPMYKAEKNARLHGVLSQGAARSDAIDTSEFEPVEGAKLRMINAFIPISAVIFGTVAGLIVTGYDHEVWGDYTIGFGKKLSITLGQSDSYKALLWSSVAGLVLAIFLSVIQRIMTFEKAIETSVAGFKTMVNAVIVLVLAWSLALVTEQLHTADFLAMLATDTIPVWSVPALTFIIALLVSFSTGSAWGTMAIIYPLMLPLSWQLSIQGGLETEAAMALFYNVTACVLAGAVFGDHCSPISDTTILSSLATQCDHVAHVRTQMPYAITVGIVALMLTVFSSLAAVAWYINLLIGAGMLYFILRLIGKRVDG